MSEATAGHVLTAARVLFQPGDVVEVRVPKAGRQRTISGYFDDFEKLAQAVAQLEGAKYPGIYWTLNPVNRALLARSENKTKSFAEATTNGTDVLCRRWLPIDLDPKRPTGISSTAEEKAATLALGEQVRAALMAEGWPEPIYADSGNGAHLLYPVELANDPAAGDLIKRILEALATRFDTSVVQIDRAVFDPNRIVKIYGTTARKGDHTAERPHRLSQILQLPALLTPVSAELLRLLAGSVPPASRPTQASRPSRGSRPIPAFDMEGFLSKHGIVHDAPMPFEGGRKWRLEQCPFDASHKSPDAAVFEGPDGRLGFKCFHNSCQGRAWREFRELFEGPRPARRDAIPHAADTEGALPQSDASDEIPLSAADVEAAIDAAIAGNDLAAAMRLIPEIAKLPIQSHVLIQSKLRLKFKRDFPARDFARALRELIQKRDELPPAPPDDDDDGTVFPPDAPDLMGYPLTDSGNGERIVKLYGDDIRWCVEFQKWLLWDGRRWKVDQSGAVTQKAKDMARLLYKQAKDHADSGMRRVLQEHARASESHAAITAALKRASSEPGLAVTAAELDQHRYLLNCLNGVVDVRTGELLQFERRYLITKLCGFKFNIEARSPRFDKFLGWAMGESADDAADYEKIARLVGFLQKSFGYALTGDVSEKAAFIFYGRTGNNGKTTLLTIFTTILAEYSAQLDINTLMTTKLTDNNMRADMAKLHGARLVITSEVDDGQKLSERLMKYLTAGMGKIVACRKFENPIEFDATHKIFMDANYRPVIRGADKAIWARLKCVPFEQHLADGDPEIDKKLKDKILAEAEGVLAWAVRGAMRWAKEGGLGAPPEIKEANVAWQEADDPLKDFLEDCCEAGSPEDGFWVRAPHLSAAYDQWCKENREKYALGRGQLKERLLLKGFKESRSRRCGDGGTQARTWEGLKLRPDVTLTSGPRSGVLRDSGTF